MTEKEFISSRAKALKPRVFPDEFIPKGETRLLSLPPVRLNLGDDFFGSIDVLNAHNVPVYSTPDAFEAKYIVYASREKRDTVRLPLLPAGVKAAVIAYEKYLDECMRGMLADYRDTFPDGKNATICANEIMRILDLVRF